MIIISLRNLFRPHETYSSSLGIFSQKLLLQIVLIIDIRSYLILKIVIKYPKSTVT